MSSAMPDRSVLLRRLRCQSLICLPFAFFALALMAGESRRSPPTPGQAAPEGVAEEVEAGVLAPSRRFVPWQYTILVSRGPVEPEGPQPFGNGGRTRACASESQWMTRHPRTFERTARGIPAHPRRTLSA